MKYSALIRKLVAASEDAKYQKKDIVDKLKVRCTSDADIIRQTLMNAVCDPRFRMHVASVPGWRKLVRTRLENFAARLEDIGSLTEDVAMAELDELLTNWFEEVMHTAEHHDSQMCFADFEPKYTEEELERALGDYVDGRPTETDTEANNVSALSWFGEETKDALGLLSTGSENDSELYSDEGSDTDNELLSDMDSDSSYGYEAGKGRCSTNREIEDRFLHNVPPSLIELAKRIGRSGQNDKEIYGSFLSASKSDIAGITTGNDLSCLLPSELAIMADKKTENIFYKNYVTRNLQLFASASQSIKGRKHDNGPIIVCLDTSSSMAGEPIIVAKALTFAVCIIAMRRKRKVIVVKYSNHYSHLLLSNISAQRKKLYEFLSTIDEGGNNEDMMFKGLFGEILPNVPDYHSSDVLCISDFGWSAISKETMDLINEEKKKDMMFYGLNIGDGELSQRFSMSKANSTMSGSINEYAWGSPADVCDSLWEYRNNVCKEVHFNDRTNP